MADPRFFAKLDVGYFDNPKVADFIEDDPRVLLLHLRAIVYCRQHLTDGRFPIKTVARLVCATYCGSQCDGICDFCAAVDAGLFVRIDTRAAEVHDYLKHQDSAEQVAKRREAGQKAAERRWGAKGDAKGNAPGNADRNAEGNAEERRGEERTSGGPRKRASRIDPDFTVTDEHRAWAKAKDLDYLDLDHITEKFVDYWLGKSGKDATKADWTATWRNWIRREAEGIPKPTHLRLASGDHFQAKTVDQFGYHDE